MTRGYRTILVAVALAGSAASLPAHAGTGHLTVVIGGLDRNGRLPDQAAFCPPPSSARKNISPAIRWSAGPRETRSYALLMVDPDVPQDFSQINRAGITIAADAARIAVHHWVLVDIPVEITSLDPGAESEGLVPHGKPIGQTRHGRRGANVYTTFLAANAAMAGTYGGYDGPCPPANDERLHRYVVRVFALDVPSLGLAGDFDGPAAERAMRGHVLARGETVASYTLNAHSIAEPPRRAKDR